MVVQFGSEHNQKMKITEKLNKLKISKERFLANIPVIICGAWIFYDYITDCLDFSLALLVPAFILLSTFSILIPSKTSFFNGKYSGSFMIWLFLMLFAVLIPTTYHALNNYSPVIYSTEYFSDDGMDFDFRENGTFRVRHTDLFSSSLQYGRYIQQESMIILKDKVKFRIRTIPDTLFIKDKGIALGIGPRALLMHFKR